MQISVYWRNINNSTYYEVYTICGIEVRLTTRKYIAFVEQIGLVVDIVIDCDVEVSDAQF